MIVQLSRALPSLCKPDVACWTLFLAMIYCLMDLHVAEAKCQWNVAVTSQDQPFEEMMFIQDREPIVPLQNLPENLFVNIKEKEYWSFQYYLYLQVFCNSQPSPGVARTLASSGMVPVVTVTHTEQRLENRHSIIAKYTLRGALMDVNGNTSLTAELTRPAWLVPLVSNNWTRVMSVHVETDGTGYDVGPVRQWINVDGYHERLSVDTTIYTSLLGPSVLLTGDWITQALLRGRPYEVAATPGETPTYVLAGLMDTSVVILSSSEFISLEAVEAVLTISDGEAGICTNTPHNFSTIRQALSLTDRILLSTPCGLYEVFGQYSLEPTITRPVGIVRNKPLRHYRQLSVQGPSRTNKEYVLAIEESGNKVYRAVIKSGSVLDFEELLDVQNQGVCEIADYAGKCSVISVALQRNQEDAILVLVERDTAYCIVAFQGSQWQVISNFSQSQHTDMDGDNLVNLAILQPPVSRVDSDAALLLLRGMTSSGIISSHLFLWGRRLLHSPDGGISLYVVPGYISDANITLFAVSQDVEFAFLNELDEIWYGMLGEIVTLQRLRPSSGFSFCVSLDTRTNLTGMHLSDQNNETTLSLFFDLNDQLQELVASVTGTPEMLSVRRRVVPVGDIVEHEAYVSFTNEFSEVQIGGSAMTPPSCPYDELHFESGETQLYAREERFTFGAPSISFPAQLHTTSSLQAYQAVVQTLVVQSKDATLEVHEFDTFDPFYHWRQGLLPLLAYNNYAFRNRLLGSHIAVLPQEYVKEYDSESALLPEEIFLDLQESYSFSVFLTIDEDFSDVPLRSLDQLRISVEVSNLDLIEVTTKREVVYLNSSVKYQVRVADRGNLQSLQTQQAPGIGLQTVSIFMQMWNSPFNCFSYENYQGNQLQGTKSLSVKLGCPPARHLIFDISATLQLAKTLHDKIYDCPVPDPEFPCFYYKQGFNPVFRILDLVTGKSHLFTSEYTLSVIGGSVKGPDAVDYFTQNQLQQYNLQNGSGPLIWKPMDMARHDGASVPIFSHNQTGILWQCDSGSPCASVPTNFPWPPEYYFVIEVTNRNLGVNSTYCEYTTQFTIKVHGLELSKNDLLAIVGWSLLVSVVLIIVFVICRQQESGFHKRRPHKRRPSRVAPMPTIQEVDTLEYSESEEVIDIVEGRGFDDISMEGSINRSSGLRVPDSSISRSSHLQVPSFNFRSPRQRTSQV